MSPTARHTLLLASLAWLVLPLAAGAATWEVGPGQSIQQALTRTKPGDVVRVQGLHRENVRMLADVVLEGLPGGVIEGEKGPAVTMEGIQGWSVRNLTLRARGLETGSGVVEVNSARGELRDCTVAGDGNGIVVRGSASPTLVHNTCVKPHPPADGGGIGIVYLGTAGGVARDNRCQDHSSGIAVLNSASPLLIRNTCVRNRVSGMAYLENAGGVARDNVCTGNKVGIGVQGSSKPKLSRNPCRKNSLQGILVAGKSAPELLQNLCEGNHQCGIAFVGESSGRARQNTCTRNRFDGISVLGAAAPDLLHNTCDENGLSGIHFFQQARGEARENVCRKNARAGIVVGDRAKPVLLNNTGEHDGHPATPSVKVSPTRKAGMKA
ncbi:MAG: right-handed parallel beta-helix repeat-containing protein [bacterium]|nr:right-handed parallel beta-helix repeat-containing protein [bacterium]